MYGEVSSTRQAVHEWFLSVQNPDGRCKPLPLTRQIIRLRAKLIAKELETQLPQLAKFTASDGWFRSWRWRYSIGKSVRLHGEAGDVDLTAVETEMELLRTKLESFETECIINMDESALLYRCLPNRSYVSEGGDARQLGRGTKAMKAKDRLTMVLCVNATGSFKCAPLLIGTAKNPLCFRSGTPCPLPYIDQSNGWVDKIRYRHWFQNVFLPAVRNFTSKKVALIMDSCSGHDKECQDPEGQVTVFFLPPNCTSMYQPLDQGIIGVLKTKYKTKMLMKVTAINLFLFLTMK